MKAQPNGDGSSSAAEPADCPGVDMAPEEFRRLGHHLVDRVADFLAEIPNGRVAPDVSPAEVRSLVAGHTFGEEPRCAEELLDRAADLLFQYVRVEGHPRSWGYISGSAAPVAMLGDFLASAVNPNVIVWNCAPVAAEIELQTVRWLAEFLGYPADTAGLVLSGGNMANNVGLLAARCAKAGWDFRADGMVSPDGGRLRLYASRETHTWLEKALDLYGFGTGAVRWLECDADGRAIVGPLRDLIREDAGRGDKPFLVIGTAGTTNTAAVDPLTEMAAVAREFDLWFHVDGAYGAPAVNSASAPPDLAGLREADSLAVDAHKWLFAPLEAGVALVRDRQVLRETFTYLPPYYVHYDHPDEEPVDFYQYGPQNSRGFKALKLWLVFQSVGRREFRRLIDGHLAQAGRLAALLAEHPCFEVFTRSLSVVTFRFVPEGLDPEDAERDAYLDRLNTALLESVQKCGELYVSNAVVGGKFLLRTCIVSFRTRDEDIDAAPPIIARLGEALHQSFQSTLSQL